MGVTDEWSRRRRHLSHSNIRSHKGFESTMKCVPMLLFFAILLPQVQIMQQQHFSVKGELSNMTTTAKPNYLETGRQITGILDRFMSLGYDKRVRPNYAGPPVEVSVTMRILSISSVSEVMMDFTADFYFRQTWHDPRLSFKKLGDIQTLYVGAEVSKKIWLPDTFFGNEKLAYFHEATTPNVFLRIDHSGEVYRSIRLTVTSACPMNLQYFPMDRQRCTIEAESYGYNVKDIIYRWARNDTAVERDKEISLPQFDIVKTVQKYRLEKLSSGTYSRLIAEIHFARRMGYYLIQIYIPSSLIVVISWVSFWLHRNASPARVQLGVTTVLTMTTLMSSTNAALPKISYVKSIDIFLGTCFIMVFAALLEYATVGYLGKRIAMRKAHVQHAQSQAQARVFAQLQAQGAQGEPVPPSATSLLAAAAAAGTVAPQTHQSQTHQSANSFQVASSELSPNLSGYLMSPGAELLLQQQQHHHPLAGATSNPVSSSSPIPQAPERHVRCNCAHCHASRVSHACHAHRTNCCQCSKQPNGKQRSPFSGCGGASCTGGGTLANAITTNGTACGQHCQQACAGSLTLPRNLTFNGAYDMADKLSHSHQAHQLNHSHDHQPNQLSPGAQATHCHGANINALAPQQPPSYCSKGASVAATAAAATLVNLHRRNKGLPPSTNPNFAQFAWIGQHDKSLETIFGVRPSDIDKYSRVVFPVCFVCFQLMYWIVYLHISAFLETEQQQQQPTS